MVLIIYISLVWILVGVTGSKIINYAEKGTCGKAFNPEFRIVGGTYATKAEFPWLVSLTRRGGHICGGTIISEKFILTAAHCVCSGIGNDHIKPNTIKVTLSQHDLDNKNSDAYNVGVKALTTHPGYKCSFPNNDIAILELNHEIQWSESVAPACLSLMENRDEFDDSLVTVAGWGWTHENHEIGKRSNTLQRAQVHVINVDQCKQWYMPYENRIHIQDSQICAGYEDGGVDACWVDSGGPLMHKAGESHDQTMLIGVVSTGIGCGRKRLPGIYTRVSDYIPWIEEILRK